MSTSPVIRDVDLSSDVGERPGPAGLAEDFALLRIVTSANVACGGHAGDRVSMRAISEVAVANGVAIGAQVSYVDREGFGRRRLAVPREVLTEQLREQWGELADASRGAGGQVTYMRPHGALYNAALVDAEVAEAVLDATPVGTPVLCLAGSVLARLAAERGHRVVSEIFADRALTDDGLLVPRGQPGAVIEQPSQVAERLAAWLRTGNLSSATGRVVRLAAQSICVHSDTPGALQAAASVREALLAAGANLRPFAVELTSAQGDGVRGVGDSFGPASAARPSGGLAGPGLGVREASHASLTSPRGDIAAGLPEGFAVHQYGEQAVLVDVAGVAGIAAAEIATLARGVFGTEITDAVPAAECVLLRFAKPVSAPHVDGVLRRVLGGAGTHWGLNTPGGPGYAEAFDSTGLPTTGAAAPESPREKPTVTIDVRYDGPDLAAVAVALTTSVEAVVALHSQTVFDVAFFGFSPGFAYLTGLPERLHLPRLATPRTAVRAGAVAIAAAYSAVYPRVSPGGWHLIGHTDAVMFDARRDPPALLEPGARVRFRAI